MKIDVERIVKEEIDITTIEVIAHCRDCCITYLINGVGDVLYEQDGYVPSFLPGDHGDSLNLIIDIETGQIQNWPEITKNQLEDFINKNED